MTAEVLKHKLLSAQVCVPADWSDEQVIAFAEEEIPSKVTGGWIIRREGDDALCGYPERNPCAERADHVHIMLDV